MMKATLYFRGIPKALKDAFRGKCTTRGDTMQDVVEAFMRLYLKKPEVVENELQYVKIRKGKP